MHYNGVLLDLDNTLYDYKIAHNVAINEVFSLADKKNLVGFNVAYKRAYADVHIELSGTAASHNRLIYFQRACEYAGINPLTLAMQLYNCYWDSFLKNVSLREGVIDFLINTNQKAKICLITDLTAHIQYRKIDKLSLAKYLSYIVTSEEAGVEKPHPDIFLMALRKLKLQASQVCMIGDNYSKDIIGAEALGIKSYWLNIEGEKQLYDGSNVTEFRRFKELNELLWMS